MKAFALGRLSSFLLELRRILDQNIILEQAQGLVVSFTDATKCDFFTSTSGVSMMANNLEEGTGQG
jgi:hypothetical protein